jgi:peptidylprolyl isomerase
MSFGQRNLDREKPEIDFPEGPVPTELVPRRQPWGSHR